MLIWIIFIVSLIVATIVANTAQQLYMRVIGASGMFFSGGKKLVIIIGIALFLTAIIIKLFGIEIPK